MPSEMVGARMRKTLRDTQSKLADANAERALTVTAPGEGALQELPMVRSPCDSTARTLRAMQLTARLALGGGSLTERKRVLTNGKDRN